MNKISAIGCLLGICFVCAAPAQEVRPKEPLLAPMPARSAWVLEFQNATGPESKKEVPPTINRITIFKDGTTYRVTSEKSIGGCQEAWVVDGRVFLLSGDAARCALVDWSAFPCTDFSAGDFENFQWLRSTDYLGVGDLEGKKAFVFEADSLKRPMSARDRAEVSTAKQSLRGEGLSTEEGPSTWAKPVPDSDVLRLLGWGTTCRVWMDIATQKPLCLETGDFRIRVKYLPPPESLVLPPSIAARLEAIRKEEQLFKKRPTRPK